MTDNILRYKISYFKVSVPTFFVLKKSLHFLCDIVILRKMKIILRFLTLCSIFLVISPLLGGCEVFLEGTVHTVSGYVFFDNRPLEGVNVTDKVTVYATTDENGFFKFDTKKKHLGLYPQKSGFVFEGRQVDINSNVTVQFVAQRAQKLSGKFVLSKVYVVPVSIVSFSENNFLYNQNCLKINQINININDTVISNRFEDFAPTNQYTNVLGNNSFTCPIDDGYVCIKISYELSTFYKIYNHESIAIENPRILRTQKVVDTGSLFDGKFEMHASGINSVHNGFSYNVAFVFDYIEE